MPGEHIEAMGVNDVLDESVRAVVLDLDGTLYNKRHLACRMVVAHLFSLSLLAAERTARSVLKGKNFGSKEAFYARFFQQMAQSHLYSPRIARWWYFHIYMPSMVRVLRRHYRPCPWVGKLMVTCRKRGIRVAVYSDYDYVAKKIAALGMHADMFDVVLSAPETGGLKPARESAMRVVERLGVAADNCLFVGDREDTDGESARAIGAKFCLVNDN